MSLPRPPAHFTVARVQAIDISLNWRWAPVLALGTCLLAVSVLPARFPAWATSTMWLMSAAAVAAGELALLLHELSHALVARRRGHAVERIVFHGFHAHTVLGADVPDVAVALVGPAMNLGLALVAEALRLSLETQGPLDVFLIVLAVGNLLAALMSLLPVGDSDGARALTAWRRPERGR